MFTARVTNWWFLHRGQLLRIRRKKVLRKMRIPMRVRIFFGND